jgi:histidinol-phosphatase
VSFSVRGDSALPEVRQRLELGRTLAIEAARRTLRWFPGPVPHALQDSSDDAARREDLTHDTKADGSPVTIADRDAETFLRESLERAYPKDAQLGEEFGALPGSSGFRWIIDPIDGTVSFVHGVPLYGTLLGLELDGATVAGVIVLPALDEVVWGGPGVGAWHEVGSVRVGDSVRVSPARVSATRRLRDATAAITSLDFCVKAGRPELLARLQAACHATRGWSDCYAAVLAATGRVDAVVEPVMKPWDVAAIAPIIEAAGGRCTDFDGVRSIESGNAAFSNGLVHDELLEVVGANR